MEPREMQKMSYSDDVMLDDCHEQSATHDSANDTPAARPQPAADGGWSGEYDQRTLHRPGGLLMAALVQHATVRGESIAQLAEQLGFSYPYINLLMSGTRKVTQASDDFIHACAVYLRIPRLTAMMLAGRVTPADVFELGKFNSRMLEPAMEYIAADSEWSGLLTAQLRSSSAQSKYCLVKMYEKATGRKLLADELDTTRVAQELAAMHAQIAREDAMLKERRHQG